MTKEEIEILREELLRDFAWLPDGRVRLNALCDMAAAHGDVERTCVSVPRADIEKWMKALDHHATDGYYNNWGVIYTIRDMRQLLYNNSASGS